ncbi:hypothetical protein JCM8097_003806 [Rhodosporidiobolus ruineniae]
MLIKRLLLKCGFSTVDDLALFLLTDEARTMKMLVAAARNSADDTPNARQPSLSPSQPRAPSPTSSLSSLSRSLSPSPADSTAQSLVPTSVTPASGSYGAYGGGTQELNEGTSVEPEGDQEEEDPVKLFDMVYKVKQENYGAWTKETDRVLLEGLALLPPCGVEALVDFAQLDKVDQAIRKRDWDTYLGPDLHPSPVKGSTVDNKRKRTQSLSSSVTSSTEPTPILSSPPALSSLQARYAHSVGSQAPAGLSNMQPQLLAPPTSALYPQPISHLFSPAPPPPVVYPSAIYLPSPPRVDSSSSPPIHPQHLEAFLSSALPFYDHRRAAFLLSRLGSTVMSDLVDLVGLGDGAFKAVLESIDGMQDVEANERLAVRAALEAARRAFAAGSYRLRVFSSKDGLFARLNCIGNGSRKHTSKGGATRGTCGIYAHLETKTQLFRVRKSVEEHSCRRLHPDSEGGKATRKDMKARLAALDEVEEDEETTISEGGSSDDSASSQDSGVSSDQDANTYKSSSSVTLSGRLSVEPDRLGHKSSSKRRRVNSDLSWYKRADENLNAASGKSKRKSSSIPKLSKRAMQAEISSLAEVRPLVLPPPTQSFHDYRSLALQVYAWAEQTGLKLNHANASDRIVFYCVPDYKKPRCSFEITARKGSDGRWRRTGGQWEHDLEKHPEGAYLGKQPIEAASTSSASPSDSKRSSRRPSSAFSAPSQPSAPAPPAPPSQPLGPEHLSAFLASLSSSTSFDAPTLQSFLLLSGVSTVVDIVALAEFEERTIVELVEAVKTSERWTDEQAYRVVEGLEVLRAAFERA